MEILYMHFHKHFLGIITFQLHHFTFGQAQGQYIMASLYKPKYQMEQAYLNTRICIFFVSMTFGGGLYRYDSSSEGFINVTKYGPGNKGDPRAEARRPWSTRSFMAPLFYLA